VETYESIKKWKDGTLSSFIKTSASLNEFHDQVMLKVLEVAKGKMKRPEPPCEFAWFITGSGGRFEQGIISDQDHGIIYELSNEEISYGMDCTGYPYCNGKIMCSNPIWCKSLEDWKKQLNKWMENERWESIRYLQIFYDARVLFGNIHYLNELKSSIYSYHLQHPSLLQRFISNVRHMKNVIGPMGQILVEQHGVYQGCVNLKYSAFLPYVNAVRLLAIKEGIFETSTIDRIDRLQEKDEYQEMLRCCKENFITLTKYRLSLLDSQNYDDTHYLNIKNLTKEQRKELKQILKCGKRLHDEVIELTLAKY
jgi:CBS domain-containing protein